MSGQWSVGYTGRSGGTTYDIITPAEAIRRLKTLPKEYKKAVGNSVRRALSRGRKTAMNRLKVTGIARKLKARVKRHGKSGSVPLVIKRSRLKYGSDGSIHTGLEAHGMARLIQIGGKTKAHIIDPAGIKKPRRRSARRKALAASGQRITFFSKRAGRWFSPRMIRHPGSRIPKKDFLRPAARETERQLMTEVEKGITEAIGKAGL